MYHVYVEVVQQFIVWSVTAVVLFELYDQYQ